MTGGEAGEESAGTVTRNRRAARNGPTRWRVDARLIQHPLMDSQWGAQWPAGQASTKPE